MDKDLPCCDCEKYEYCDGWDAQFCCKLCKYKYGEDTPCENCDTDDI